MKTSTTSLIAQQKLLREQRDALDRQLEAMQRDADAITDICDQVKKLANDQGVSVAEIALALAPELNKPSRGAESPAPTRTRQVKIYKNPHNGEKIETKGGNHKLLKQWKAEHGAGEVESWRSQ